MANLKCHYGIKMRIFPSTAQKKTIDNNINANRFAYNEMVAIDKELFQLRRVKCYISTIADRIAYLQKRKNNTQMLFAIHPWLEGTHVGTDVIDQARRSYQAAWNLFRKVHRSGTPKFHKKQMSGNFRIPNRYANVKPNLFNGSCRFLDGKHVKLNLIGRIRISGSHKRLFANGNDIRIGTITVSRDAIGHYYLAMQLGSDIPFVETTKRHLPAVGIDLNTDNFLTDSNGAVVANPRYYRSIKGKLAKAQRKLSRRALRAVKEHRPLRKAKNYQRQRIIVATIQRKVANQRNNFLHLVSTTLIKNHDLVVAEELRSENMLRNHALAMSISDVGWRTFLGMLAYKADLYGKKFVTVNPRNTTQTCNACGFVMGTDNTAKLTLSDREWQCPHCGVHHIRDWNAAKNILDKGLASA